MPQSLQHSGCTVADQSSVFLEPAVEEPHVGSLAAKLLPQENNEADISSLVVKQYKYGRRNVTCHGCDTVSEYTSKACDINVQPSGANVTCGDIGKEQSSAPRVVVNDWGYSLINNEDDRRSALVLWPKLWLHEAETLLHIARVGLECIKQYRSYLERVNNSRASFICASVGASPTSDVVKYLLYNRASQLIDVTLSLKNQECWSATVRWLQDKARFELLDTGRIIDELFQFDCDEALELQQHFREDAGENESTTRELVWDFLSAVETQWSSGLDYLVRNLEAMLPHISNPKPGEDELPEPEVDQVTEPIIPAQNATDAEGIELMVHETKGSPSSSVTAVDDAVVSSLVDAVKPPGAVVRTGNSLPAPYTLELGEG